MLSLYITSPRRHEGKTFITAGIAATMQSLGYSVFVYKPVQTGGIERNGFTQSQDLTFIKTIDPYINTRFSYLFKLEAEPMIAAEIENNPIDVKVIAGEYSKITSISECTLIDGSCGLMSPLAPDYQTADLIKYLQIPVLLVVSPAEDSINDTLLSIFAAQEKGIDVRGVVINNIREDCSKTLLTSISRITEEYTNVKILGLVSALEKGFSPEDLISAILNGVDIESIFKIKIEKLKL